MNRNTSLYFVYAETQFLTRWQTLVVPFFILLKKGGCFLCKATPVTYWYDVTIVKIVFSINTKHFATHFRERKKHSKVSYSHFYPVDFWEKVQNTKRNTSKPHLFRDQVLSSSLLLFLGAGYRRQRIPKMSKAFKKIPWRSMKTTII